MTKVLTLSTLAVLALTAGAEAGNTSSNSSSNSSNGVHTRVDTIITDDGRGRRIEERRVYRREAPPSRSLRQRRLMEDDD